MPPIHEKGSGTSSVKYALEPIECNTSNSFLNSGNFSFEFVYTYEFFHSKSQSILFSSIIFFTEWMAFSFESK